GSSRRPRARGDAPSGPPGTRTDGRRRRGPGSSRSRRTPRAGRPPARPRRGAPGGQVAAAAGSRALGQVVLGEVGERWALAGPLLDRSLATSRTVDEAGVLLEEHHVDPARRAIPVLGDDQLRLARVRLIVVLR